MSPQVLSLILFSVFVLIGVLYTLTLYRTLTSIDVSNRKMNPSLIWLLLIPIFHLLWHFYLVAKISDSITAQYVSKGLAVPELRAGYGIGIMASICWSLGFLINTINTLRGTELTVLMLLNGILGIIGFILWIVYWVKIGSYRRKIIAL